MPLRRDIGLQLKKIRDEVIEHQPQSARDYRGHAVDGGGIADYFDNSYNRLVDMVRLSEAYVSPGSRVLDVGMAYGFYTLALQRRTGSEVVGTELKENIPAYCSYLAAAGVAIEPWEAGEEELPFPNDYFDVVICAEMIEHLRFTPAILLREVHRVTKPSGRLLLTTPNISTLPNVLRLLRGKNICEPFADGEGSGFDNRAHPREYTAGEVRDCLDATGWEVEHRYFREYGPVIRKHRFNPGTVVRAAIKQSLYPYRRYLVFVARKIIANNML